MGPNGGNNGGGGSSQADLDNHANQLNDNNNEYYNSRDEDGRPDDWDDSDD